MTDSLKSRYLKARGEYIASCFPDLNDKQLQAIATTEGPLLLLAGAGSGKTTVLINRIACLIRFGKGNDIACVPESISERDILSLESLKSGDHTRNIAVDQLCAIDPVPPWNILAITFTNKAAGELKSRLTALLGNKADDIWAMTFHSACCRILRRNIDALGFSRNFTIYDTSDTEKIMKDVLKELNLDEKSFNIKYTLNAVSRAKDHMQSPDEALAEALNCGDLKAQYIAKVYKRYQQHLTENNALDFDDIIYLTVRLLQSNLEILQYYQRKFRYIMVDEYQDTNHMQYLLTALLAGGSENICVVGDDDQSIYRFRGATIDNILNFEKQYTGAKTIRLEQNYRSTQAILNAANGVISHNIGRKGKTLWTDNGSGDAVIVYEATDENAEANYVARQILSGAYGRSLREYAILYRTNAQSNALEYALKRNGIAYRVIGGTRFFDRAEVKDILAYLCVINNPSDTFRLRRIVNNPPRGLGAKALETAERFAAAENVPLYEIISHAGQYNSLEKASSKLHAFTELICELQALLADDIPLSDFYDEVLARTGYEKMLQTKDTEESRTRLENIHELKSSILNYMQTSESPSLAGFLEEISLYTDIEQYDASDDAVVMMTMHSAKGLEFSNVFLVGFEDGLFPGQRAIGDAGEIEEERRLCYVAITRAKKHLTISYARQRMIYGKTASYQPSRFLQEIPCSCVRRLGGDFEEHRGYMRPADVPPHYNRAKSFGQSTAERISKSQPVILLNPGDQVMHKAFGKGLVLTVVPMPGDAMLEIAFDETGTRKLMAKAATQYLTKL